MVTTRKTNADKHPGRVDKKKTKRTKEKIKADKARAKAEARGREEEARAEHRTVVNSVARLEDVVALVEEDARTHADRPDLQYDPPRPQPKELTRSASRPGSQDPFEPRGDDELTSEQGDPEQDDTLAQSGADATLDGFTSDFAREDDEGQVLAHRASDEHNDDAEHTQSTGSDEERITPARYLSKRGKKKEKNTGRGSFRAEVNTAHKNSTSEKWKTPPGGTLRTVSKRVKEATVGGLSYNWKAKTEHIRRQGPSVTSRIMNTEVENNSLGKGRRPLSEPGKDEDDVIATARDSASGAKKCTARRPTSSSASVPVRQSTSTTQPLVLGRVVGPSRNTDQMGVTVRKAANTAMVKTGSWDPKEKSVRRPRPTLMDLPLPQTGRYHQNWRKKFVPLLISWAGSQEDPFGTNGQIDGAIESIWERVYPDLAVDDEEMDIIVILAENTLNNWRSDIGKAGHRAVVDMWDTDPSKFSSPKGQANHVADNLKNLQFLYENPKATSGRGAFCSHLVSKVFSLHIRKISTGPDVHIPQVGGLALAAAAVERGLTFFKTGEDMPRPERDPETGRPMPRHNRGLGFSDSLWGNKAREFVKTTTRLTEKHWEEIIDHTAIFMNTYTIDSDDEGNTNNTDAETDIPNSRALIDLDCVEFGLAQHLNLAQGSDLMQDCTLTLEFNPVPGWILE
ncbi:hypothetical protein EDB84DRAFT_1441288 [Lactarius hengduanensis]|nr:hypothetical protein EDB84DRAFT_1441288 [Lactarius hengduanensis]